RHTLNNLGEITCGVVWWEQRKLRTACRSDFENAALEHLAGVHIHANLRGISGLDVGQLCLAEVSCDPARSGHKRHYLRSRADQLSRANLALSHGSIGRCHNTGVSQVYLSDSTGGFLCVKVGEKLAHLRFKYSFATAFRFGSRFVAS